MAKKKPTDSDAKRGGPRKLAIPAVALVLGVFVGPKLLGANAGTAEAAAETTTTTAPGPVVTLDSITLNLTDGHLLKVGLALQVSAAWLEEHGDDAGSGGHGAPAAGTTTDPTSGYARAVDAAIGVFTERSMAQLVTGAGREEARAELTQRLHDAYHGEIESIYFYEFVMQ